jgi:peptide/nickel transport system substrate-binding protein
MTLNVKRSRRVRQIAIGLGLALAVSTVGVSGSSAAKVQAGKKGGGDITVGVFNQLLTTCFSPNASNSALGIMKTVYEGFFEKKSNGEIVPYLAEAVTPSADFKTWTIKLRSGIKFHDGTDLNAAVGVANVQATAGAYYVGVVSTGRGNPVHTLGSGVPFAANFKAATAIDSMTFKIDLWNGQVDWPATMYASGRNFVRAISDLTNATQCATKGQGTGPFKFVSVSPTETKVTKNTSYWRKDSAGEQLPYLNSITFKYVNQATQRVNGLKSGTLDAAQFTSAGEIKQILNVKENKNLQLIESRYDYYAMSMLNHAIEPFNKLNARLAVAYAYDSAAYYKARNCFKGKCLGEIPSSVVGKTNIGYNKAGFITYNLAKAKEYVAKYKAETGKDLTFTLPADPSAESQGGAKTFAQIMKKAGITVNISTEDTATITANAFPSVSSGKTNPYQMYPTTLFEGTGTEFTLPFVQSNAFNAPGNLYVAGLTRASAQLGGLFRAFGALINPSRLNDPALDALVWKAQFDTTSTRTANIKAVTKYLQENATVLPAPTLGYSTGLSKKLKGYDRFTLASGGAGVPMTNAGINWVGVYLEK